MLGRDGSDGCGAPVAVCDQPLFGGYETLYIDLRVDFRFLLDALYTFTRGSVRAACVRGSSGCAIAVRPRCCQ